jgi:TPR repeat protein
MACSRAARSSGSGSDGSAEMLFHLGMMYCLGREVDQDYVTAHKWFNIAALRGSEAARRHRCDISREMTARQISDAQRELPQYSSV